ncbi:MAG TPA: hypothetical protein ENI57_07500 [Ignavibacteria bacterium]|nr:hypothetical protein [Ignavibacteria bacterium]
MILTKSKNKNIKINSEIDTRIRNGEISNLLLIVPTNRKVRYLKKEIITSSPNGSAQSINLETISTFSTKIVLNDTDIRRAVLSEPASFVLLEQAFNEIDPKYFSNYKNNIPTGTLQQIKNVISEYKKHGITPQILRNEFNKLNGSERLKAENIADIYETYQAKLEKIRIKEIGDIYKEIGELSIGEFIKRFREFYPEVNFIAANGFDEFTQPEINIMNLCSQIPGVDLYFHIDYQANNDSIFFHLNTTYLKLMKKGFDIIKEKDEVSKNQFENYIRDNLFNSKSPKNKIDYSEKIYILAALDKGKEIEIISKEIKDLITNQQVHPSEICIAFNSIQKYSSTIRDVLSTYGIPLNLTDRFTCSSSRPVVSVINILEVLENDFYYKDILRALNSGYLMNLNINSSNILKSARSLKIISGLRNWMNTLKDEIYIRKNNTGNEWDELLRIETFEDALSSLQKIQGLLNPFEDEMTLNEFKDNVIELIYKLEIPIKLSDDTSFNAEKNIKSMTTFIEVLEELTNLFISQYGEDKKFPLKFYLNYLRTAAKSTRYNVKEKPNYGVQVTSINEIRGLKFNYLFLSGLCDGDFPTRYQPEIFFSGSYFKKENQHQAKERYQFYQALCSWEKKLYLTFPLTDEKKDLVKSTFITELESIIKTSTLEPGEFTNKIYSKEEFLIEVGNKGIDYFNTSINKEEYEFDLEEIESAVKIDKLRREDPFGNSSFNGVIGDDLKKEVEENLAGYKEKQFSYSQLETYAKCPYKYFAERVLKIEPNEEPTEEMEFHELGTLLHLILYEFYTRLQKEGIVLSGCGNAEFNKAKELIFKIAEDRISEAYFNSPLTFFEKERILGIEGKKENSILYRFLLTERENNDGFVPTFFETGFGHFSKETDERLSLLKELKIGDVKIRGKIDRIELNEGKDKFQVVDYKLSGKSPTLKNLREGIALQIPLYLYAAKELIKAQIEKDSKPAGGKIYSLKYKSDKFGKKLVKPFNKRNFDETELIEENEKVIEECIENIKRYVRHITEGKFNLSTLSNRESEICRFCGFKSVCRIQEVT